MVYVANSVINQNKFFYLISQPLAQSFETRSIYQDSSYHIMFMQANNFSGSFMQPHSMYPSFTVVVRTYRAHVLLVNTYCNYIIRGLKERKDVTNLKSDQGGN